MEKEIKEIIEKSLPAQVGDVLRKRLEQAEEDAETVVNYKKIVSDRNHEIGLLKKIIEDYKQFDERNSKLEAREQTVKEAEINLKVSTLEYQLLAEKDKTIFSQNLAMGLVRNTEYRKTIFDNENQVGYYDGNGHWICPTPINKSLTETKTVE